MHQLWLSLEFWSDKCDEKHNQKGRTSEKFGKMSQLSLTRLIVSFSFQKMNIDNVQFALLEASEDFMATVLLLPSGLITDRIGGAGTSLPLRIRNDTSIHVSKSPSSFRLTHKLSEMIVYGNIIYTIGSILVAAAATVRSFNFMIGGRIILAFGDIATQIAQYKMFSSWFAPSNGFASTLGFELAIGKVGGFIGKSTANIIATVRFDFLAEPRGCQC